MKRMKLGEINTANGKKYGGLKKAVHVKRVSKKHLS